MVAKIIKRHTVNTVVKPKEKIAKSTSPPKKHDKGNRPVPIVRQLFKDNPDKEFSPPEVRDVLQALKDKGELVSTSPETLRTAHSALRSLNRQKFIERIEREDKDAVYKLIKK